MLWRAITGSALFLVLAPGTVAVVIPRWLRRQTEVTVPWAVRLAGALLVFAGAVVLLDCFRRFAIEGLGTPAPTMPSRILIVSGLYRHVRNPMYVAVVSLILGQALLWADARVLAYGAAVWLAFQLFVTWYEEPTLRRTFAAQYVAFQRNVPRWIPRLSPWTPDNVSH